MVSRQVGGEHLGQAIQQPGISNTFNLADGKRSITDGSTGLMAGVTNPEQCRRHLVVM